MATGFGWLVMFFVFKYCILRSFSSPLILDEIQTDIGKKIAVLSKEVLKYTIE